MKENQTDQVNVSLKPRIRYRAVGEEGVLVDLESGRVIVVNEVGLQIIQSLGKPRSRQSLVKMLVDDFEITEESAGSDVDAFLAELDREQLVSTSSPGQAGTS